MQRDYSSDDEIWLESKADPSPPKKPEVKPQWPYENECWLDIEQLKIKWESWEEVCKERDSLKKEVAAIRDAIWGINYGSEDFHKKMREADAIRDAREKGE